MEATARLEQLDRELRERNRFLQDQVDELTKKAEAQMKSAKKEKERSLRPKRERNLSTELRVDQLKRDLRLQRSQTDEANLAIERMQRHYET